MATRKNREQEWNKREMTMCDTVVCVVVNGDICSEVKRNSVGIDVSLWLLDDTSGCATAFLRL